MRKLQTWELILLRMCYFTSCRSAMEGELCSLAVPLAPTALWWRMLFFFYLCRCVVWNDCNSGHCQAGGSPCCAHTAEHGNRRGAPNRGQQENCKSHCYSGICFSGLQMLHDEILKLLFAVVNLKLELQFRWNCSFSGYIKWREIFVELDWIMSSPMA